MLQEPTPITAFFVPACSESGHKRKRAQPTAACQLPLKKKKNSDEQANKLCYESIQTEFQRSEQMLACIQELRLFQRSGACALARLQRVLKNIFIHYEIKKHSDQMYALRSAGVQVLGGSGADLLLHIETPFDDHGFRSD